MRSLLEIVDDMARGDEGYITRDGECASGPGRGRVVKYTREQVGAGTTVPKEVSDYLKKKGVYKQAEAKVVFEDQLTLTRVSDGKQAVFNIKNIFIGFKELSPGRLPGFIQCGDVAYVRYFSPEDFVRFTDFLEQAGVGFEPYTPPWTASMKRHGMKETQSFGLGK